MTPERAKVTLERERATPVRAKATPVRERAVSQKARAKELLPALSFLSSSTTKISLLANTPTMSALG